MGKNVVIIGAGIAGLSVGCYLQKNGYQTEIYELHTLPGGLCTSWDIGDYTIDTCIHWLVGSNPKDNFYKLWNELIDLSGFNFVYEDIYVIIEDNKGNQLKIYSDLDKLFNEFMRIAPEDEKEIKNLFGYARKFLKFKMPVDKAPELYTVWDKIKQLFSILPFLTDFNKLMKTTASEFSKKFTNPDLQFAIEQMFVPEMSVLFSMMMFKWFHEKSAGYPIGGSLNFARKFEETYLNLGGKINYHSRVEKILVNQGKAYGITLKNGKVIDADIVISAADGFSTIYEMLDGKFLTDQLMEFYSRHLTFSSYIQVSFGIKKVIQTESSALVYKFAEPFQVDPETTNEGVYIKNYGFDTTFAPEGKSVIVALLYTYNYMYWNELRTNDHKQYHSEKERIAQFIKAIIKSKYKLDEVDFEITDVSTPATVIRYTNNWKGSFEGWIMTPEVGYKGIKKTIPGIDNFYMIGQWVEPGGGLPSAILSARNATQIICNVDKIKFKA